MSVLTVSSANEASALYQMLRSDVAAALPGQAAETYRNLALLGVENAAGIGARAVVLGDRDVDVARAVDMIADALGIEHLRINLGLAAGEAWQGGGIAREIVRTAGEPHGYRAAITLSDIEACRIERGGYTGVNGTGVRWGEDLARSVAPLLAGDRIGTIADTVATRHMLVVATGLGAGLPTRPSVADWADWGIPAIAARPLGRARLIRVVAPSGDDLALALLDALADEHMLFALLGYRLDVEPSALTYVAQRLETADFGGLSAGVSWLRAAASEGLAALLDGSLTGKVFTITPDSLVVPPPPKGRWVE